MNTEWFTAFATARYAPWYWPLSGAECRLRHGPWRQALTASLLWCRACCYHRAP